MKRRIVQKNIPSPIPPNRTRSLGFPELLAKEMRFHQVLENSLINLPYEHEIDIKNTALRAFWQQHHLPGMPEKIIASPLPRNYRTTSKRQISFQKGRCRADLTLGDMMPMANLQRLKSLEPKAHERIYDNLLILLNQPSYHILSRQLNFIIIRGSYIAFSVIFNVGAMDAAVVRKCKLLAEHMQTFSEKIISAFIYFDPSFSDYYLESKRPQKGVAFKNLFGPQDLILEINQRRFHYNPTCFSQVNESMIPSMLQKTAEFLSRVKTRRLLDLYCGYGLFALTLAEQFQQVIAIDVSRSAIESAEDNLRHFRFGNEIRFLCRDVSFRTLTQMLPPASSDCSEAVILDPPRQGTGNGVIPALCTRIPTRVLHIFCGIEQIPTEVAQWLKAGYAIEGIAPLDMFPGTPNLETLISFSRYQ